MLLALACVLAFALPANAAAWSWPVDGPVLRGFSTGDDPYGGGQHRGIDVGTPVGSDVRAPASGVISFAGSVPGAGRAVTIRTEDGYSITLLQLGSVAVPVRTTIAEGEVVGTVGSSADAQVAEPHVHLGIRLTAEPHGYVDPLALLPARHSRPAEPAPAPAPAPPPSAAPAPAPEPAKQVDVPPPAPAATPAPPKAQVPTTPPAARQPRAHGAESEQPSLSTAPNGRERSGREGAELETRTGSVVEPAPVLAGRARGSTGGDAVSPLPRRQPRQGAQREATSLVVAKRTDSQAAGRSSEPVRRARDDDRPSAWLLGLACIGFALCALGAGWQVRRSRALARGFEENVLRKMSPIPTAPEETHAEPHVPTDSRRRRLALCERRAAHRPCRRLRRSLGHLCSLSPASGQSRPHGQRHRRARNARHGRGRSRGRVPA